MLVPPSPRLRFPRASRLKLGRDFARLRAEGRRLACGCLAANWRTLPPATPSRLGVVVSSRVGNAVARSRARRLLREAWRLHQHDLDMPVELVLVARASIVGKKLGEVEGDFLNALRRAGLLRISALTVAAA